MTVRVVLKIVMLGAVGDTGRAVDAAVLPLLSMGTEVEHIAPDRVKDLTIARIEFTTDSSMVAWALAREASNRADDVPGVEVTSVNTTISPIRPDEPFC